MHGALFTFTLSEFVFQEHFLKGGSFLAFNILLYSHMQLFPSDLYCLNDIITDSHDGLEFFHKLECNGQTMVYTAGECIHLCLCVQCV